MAKAKFASVLLLFQGILLILFIVFVDYGDELLPKPINEEKDMTKQQDGVFQSMHIMVFLGFGLIMTFLRRYSKGMLVHCLLIGGLVIQWATLLQGFFKMENTKVKLTPNRMMRAEFAIITVFISFGAIMGKCNSLQYLIIALLETLFFSVNEGLVDTRIQAADFGRSILVHVFGAYFGIGLSRMLYSRKVCNSMALSMSNKTEFYSFLGTLFLFVYWPSLNGALVDGTAQQRASVNTFYALAASCAATFSFTVLASNESRFNILHLQNATISGGVAVGSVAALMLEPWGAVILGILGALTTVLGYKYVVPRFSSSLKIHDVRGVQAVHGLPGVISAIASIFAAAFAKEKVYRTSLYVLYPARIPAENTTQLAELQRFAEFVEGGPGREDVQQALFQLAGLVMTVVVSLTTGLLTGFIVRNRFFDPVTVEDAFDDHNEWEEVNCIDTLSDDEELEEDDHGIKHSDDELSVHHLEETQSMVAGTIQEGEGEGLLLQPMVDSGMGSDATENHITIEVTPPEKV